MPFTTVAKVKTALGIPAADTTHDDRLTAIVAGINSTMLNHFGLTATAETTYTEKYDVLDPGTPGMWLIQWPVTEIVSVTIDGEIKTLSDFYLRRPEKFGMIMSEAFDFWPVGRRRIEIAHKAGWVGDVVDEELCSAATQAAILRFNTDPKLGYDSERIGQYQYKLGSAAGGSGSSSEGDGAAAALGTIQAALGGWVRPFAPGT